MMPEDPSEDQWVPVTRAAELLGISVASVHYRIKTKNLRTREIWGLTGGEKRKFGRQLLHVRLADLEAPPPVEAPPMKKEPLLLPAAPTPKPSSLRGEDCAKIFAALKEGKTPIDVVIELGIHPEVVEEALTVWNRFSAIVDDQVKFQQLYRDVTGNDKFPGYTVALREVLVRAERNRICSGCEKQPASLCSACVEALATSQS